MSTRQILIVEDERPIREMIAFSLKRAGYAVHEAEDCRAARGLLADHRPDLLLIDWMLPDMSGLELTRLIKRDRETRDLPVIMLTALVSRGDTSPQAVAQSGNINVLPKPVDLGILTRVMEEALAK
jgi:two-component system phosphate regulon response regulator PhoB